MAKLIANRMKVLLTGATGFVGGHIMSHFGAVGHDVDYISHAEFMNEDWSKLDGNPDAVVHCAWPLSIDLHSTEHMEFAEWSCNFLKECSNRGIRVINIGSSSEYGVKYEPMREDMACEPVNTYGIAKLAVTLFAKNLGYNTLRIFSPHGENGKNLRSIMADLDGKELLLGNPLDRRDYFPVKLVALAVERLIHARHIYGEIINVCSGMATVHGDLVDFGEWYKYPQKQYEPSNWQGDTAKMKRLLNL